MKKSFCFILNPLEVTGDLPVELIPNHLLQRADQEQTEIIRENINRHYAHNFPLPAYEFEWVGEVGGSGRTGVEMPSEKWRYWVITFDGPNRQTQNLKLAVNLLQNDLDIGLVFIYSQEGKGPSGISQGSINSSFFESHLSLIGDGTLKITTKELSAVGDYFRAIKVCEQEQPQIYRSIRDFFLLKSLPRNSNMVILGCFALIESLVTHNPKANFDSLTHQISTKMTLLSKRFERQLDYDGHFGQLNLNRKTVWKKLYDYRSALAHGTLPDFKSELQMLKNPAYALDFLNEATKLTILFAMKEPDFLTDLKEC